MKIIKRHNFKLERDTLVAVGMGEQMAKEMVKLLNQNYKDKSYFFQVVSDEFEIRDKA